MYHTPQDSDIRQNIPAYEVFRDGKHAGRVPNVVDLFTSDMVTFYVGRCPFPTPNSHDS